MSEAPRPGSGDRWGHDLTISEGAYQWSVRLFRIRQKLLKVNVRLHHTQGQTAQGDILLFNHFARFEPSSRNT
jgi:hypothetical protein